MKARRTRAQGQLISDAEKAEIAIRAFKGEKKHVIAKEYGVSAAWIGRCCAEARDRDLVRIVRTHDVRPVEDC